MYLSCTSINVSTKSTEMDQCHKTNLVSIDSNFAGLPRHPLQKRFILGSNAIKCNVLKYYEMLGRALAILRTFKTLCSHQRLSFNARILCVLLTAHRDKMLLFFITKQFYLV